MGVRHDRPRRAKTRLPDRTRVIYWQWAPKDPAVTTRHYLADAAFLVGLCGDDRGLLERIHGASPIGVAACPGTQVLCALGAYLDARAVVDADMRDTLVSGPPSPHPAGRATYPAVLSLRSADRSGLMKMDQPLSSFDERRFGPVSSFRRCWMFLSKLVLDPAHPGRGGILPIPMDARTLQAGSVPRTRWPAAPLPAGGLEPTPATTYRMAPVLLQSATPGRWRCLQEQPGTSMPCIRTMAWLQ